MARPTLQADYLIIGCGIAGLRAALSLARSGRVLILSKDQPTESNSGYAQGGVAVAMSEEDATESHLDDTLQAGAGIVSRSAAQILVEEGPERIRELVGWGARFDRDLGRTQFTREGAHSRNRVLHALGDATGWEMTRTLLERVQSTQNIEVSAFACANDLVFHSGRVIGCRYLDRGGRSALAAARAVLLASGGAGRMFAETTNPDVATGDGMAMAFRAGAALLDLEFVQFHPTALCITGAPRFLISEAVRGEGAYLRNRLGDRFVNELAARDQVARAIFREYSNDRGPVTLDLAHLDPDHIRTRFPRIRATCRRYSIDITRDPIPITPAAHYIMGGVLTDLDGRTTLPGLYAAGETACTGVHGANRLASNSLLDGLVFGERAAAAMLKDRSPRPLPADFQDTTVALEDTAADFDPVHYATELRQAAWKWLGLEREAMGLREMISWLADHAGSDTAPRTRFEAEARNMRDLAIAMVRSTLFREESRGAHFRVDFPQSDDRRFMGHTFIQRGENPRLVDTDHPYQRS